jgi:molybdate transport system substrate-binding protein
MALSARPRRLAAGLLAAALALLSGPGRATEITVSAASSLTNAFREIALLFEAADPGTHVQLNFGASGALLQQIARGAPVDVYASADPATMDLRNTIEYWSSSSPCLH